MNFSPQQQRDIYAAHCREFAEARVYYAKLRRQVRYGPLTLAVFTAAFWWTVFLRVW